MSECNMSECIKLESMISKKKCEEAYNKGLEDAWKMAKGVVLKVSRGGFDEKKIIEVFGSIDYAEIFNSNPQEALAKLEAYEKEKEINVGDVVESIYSGRLGVITQIKENGKFVLFMDGMAGELAHNDIKKTGKHIDISELLQKIGGAV